MSSIFKVPIIRMKGLSVLDEVCGFGWERVGVLVGGVTVEVFYDPEYTPT